MKNTISLFLLICISLIVLTSLGCAMENEQLIKSQTENPIMTASREVKEIDRICGMISVIQCGNLIIHTADGKIIQRGNKTVIEHNIAKKTPESYGNVLNNECVSEKCGSPPDALRIIKNNNYKKGD